MANILNFKDTNTYKDNLKQYSMAFADNLGGYIFCRPVMKNDGSVLMEIKRYSVLRKPESLQYRVIHSRPGVCWFKFNHKTYTYLI